MQLFGNEMPPLGLFKTFLVKIGEKLKKASLYQRISSTVVCFTLVKFLTYLLASLQHIQFIGRVKF